MSKKFDVVAVVGTYKDQQGNEKKKYQNVGVVLEGQRGPYIILEKWFNPAGIEGPCFLGMFEPKPRGQQQAPQQQGYQNQQQAQQAPLQPQQAPQQQAPAQGFDDMSQDIPF